MAEPHDRPRKPIERPSGAGSASGVGLEIIRRAFVEFLWIPTLVIVAFLLLALATFLLDAARIAHEAPTEARAGLFSDSQAARDFLSVIATSIITVTSITLSLLLIAVQQGAASLTSLVFDQFLRRRVNQFYFGFFIGLALYALIVLASVNPSHQPIYGVAAAGLMTVAALYMLVLLIYTTINQMRPVVIIRSIHDHTLLARARQRDLIRSTRRAPLSGAETRIRVTAGDSGFMVRIDVDAIARAMTAEDAEIVILMAVGDYVAFGDPLAEIRMTERHDASALEQAIRKAVFVEEQRDLDCDPAFGIEQLATIGWTSISTAKSNPGPGLLAIQNLRDLLARWIETDEAFGARADGDGHTKAPVVYADNLPEEVLKSFESLVTVASESMQHQSAAEIYRTFASLFQRLPPPLQRQAVDLLLRSLSALGEHVLTRELDEALSLLVETLSIAGHSQGAKAIETARNQLARSIGQLNTRSGRAGMP